MSGEAIEQIMKRNEEGREIQKAIIKRIGRAHRREKQY
jgi:hypothetical protein